LDLLAGRASQDDLDKLLEGQDVDEEVAKSVAENLKSGKSALGKALKQRVDKVVDDEAQEVNDTEESEKKGKGRRKRKANETSDVPDSEQKIKKTRTKGKAKSKEVIDDDADHDDHGKAAPSQSTRKKRSVGYHLAAHNSITAPVATSSSTSGRLNTELTAPVLPMHDAMDVDPDPSLIPPSPAPALPAHLPTPPPPPVVTVSHSDEEDGPVEVPERLFTPDSDRGAVGPDGRLMDASDIQWLHSPSAADFPAFNTGLDPDTPMNRLTPLPSDFDPSAESLWQLSMEEDEDEETGRGEQKRRKEVRSRLVAVFPCTHFSCHRHHIPLRRHPTLQRNPRYLLSEMIKPNTLILEFSA
jgi:hypothetical protein